MLSQVWKCIHGVGDVDGVGERFLEGGVHGRFHIRHAFRYLLRFQARRAIEQGDARPVPGGVAHGVDVRRVAVGDEAQRQGVMRIDQAAKGPGQAHALHSLDARALHKQLRTGIKGGLGQLHAADI
ncbi:hypothetical protein RZS08_16690, partial [Arthrospira platensis SPKY1]|nr:hypothetical protein [Arthrospira platensis SPKY1]